MMSRLKSKLLFSLPFLLIIALIQMIVSPAEADRLTVTARKTVAAPGGPDDPTWQHSAETRIPVKGRDTFSDEEGVVIARALYTAENLYFLFRWADPTQSTTKQSWVFDGTGWHHLAGNEDRIALLFDSGIIYENGLDLIFSKFKTGKGGFKGWIKIKNFFSVRRISVFNDKFYTPAGMQVIVQQGLSGNVDAVRNIQGEILGLQNID